MAVPGAQARPGQGRRTRWPSMAAAVPSPISRWDLPVPESPIRQRGSPFLTHSQVARLLITTGTTLGLAE